MWGRPPRPSSRAQRGEGSARWQPFSAASKSGSKPRQTHESIERKQSLRQTNRLPLARTRIKSKPCQESQSISLPFSKPHHEPEVRYLLFFVRNSSSHGDGDFVGKSSCQMVRQNRFLDRPWNCRSRQVVRQQ